MLTKSYISLSRVVLLLAFLFFIFWLNANWSAPPRYDPASSRGSKTSTDQRPGRTQDGRPDSVASLASQTPTQEGKAQVPDKLVASPPAAVNGQDQKEEVSGKDGKKDLRIAIVTFTTSEKSYTWLSLKNKNEYAKKHNYTLIVDYEAPERRGVMWHKFAMIEDVISKGQHDWIWWIDFDTLFTNLTARVEDVIEDGLAAVEDAKQRAEVDFLLTPDCFELNAGSMLVRSRASSVSFFDSARDYHNAHDDKSEQDCVRDVIKAAATPASPQHRPRKPSGWHDPPATPGDDEGKMHHHRQVVMIPQRRANAFPEEIKCHEEEERPWRKGDLLIHFAGAWAHLTEDDPTGLLMRKYKELIVEGNEWRFDSGKPERRDEEEEQGEEEEAVD